MRSISLLLAATACALVAAAPSLGDPSEDPRHPDYSPKPPHLAARDVTKGDPPGFYTCAGLHWKGPCYWQQVKYGECVPLRNDGPPYDQGAFGPDKGVKCKVYNSINCMSNVLMSAESDWIQFPGIDDKPISRLMVYSVYEDPDMYTVQAVKCEKA